MAKYKNNRLWLAIRWPDLPGQVFSKEQLATQACMVTEQRQVIWANPAAQAQGIALGMDATTAQLLCHGLVLPRHRAGEQTLLANLAAELYQFTPHIETYRAANAPHAGNLLEISSCLKLFGGSQALCHNIHTHFTTQGYNLAMGLAHTAKGAWLLSFTPYPIGGDETPELFIQRLKQVPLCWLHDYPKQIDALEKTGFTTLGDVARQIEAQSISSLKKRWGAEFAQLLCAIFDIEQNFNQTQLFQKPLSTYQPTEFFTEQLQFEYPIQQIDQLQKPLQHLLKKLAHYLRQKQLATQQIEWTLADIYQHTHNLNVYTDIPQYHSDLLYNLTLIQLENRELPFAVDRLVLRCEHTLQHTPVNPTLNFTNSRPTNNQNFTLTAAKLTARLGKAAMYKLSYNNSHIPEANTTPIPLNQPCQQQLAPTHQHALRPSWLLPTPEPITLRGNNLYWHGIVQLISGPERIQGNWWQTPTARDYFLAQRHDAVRLWVFWDLHQKAWYLQGIFG